MTSTVKISAHCGEDKEVLIVVGSKIVTIKDGETFEASIYDNIACSAQEIKHLRGASIEAGGNGKQRPPESDD